MPLFLFTLIYGKVRPGGESDLWLLAFSLEAADSSFFFYVGGPTSDNS